MLQKEKSFKKFGRIIMKNSHTMLWEIRLTMVFFKSEGKYYKYIHSCTHHLIVNGLCVRCTVVSGVVREQLVLALGVVHLHGAALRPHLHHLYSVRDVVIVLLIGVSVWLSVLGLKGMAMPWLNYVFTSDLVGFAF